jgi:hypothetical protein
MVHPLRACETADEVRLYIHRVESAQEKVTRECQQHLIIHRGQRIR